MIPVKSKIMSTSHCLSHWIQLWNLYRVHGVMIWGFRKVHRSRWLRKEDQNSKYLWTSSKFTFPFPSGIPWGCIQQSDTQIRPWYRQNFRKGIRAQRLRKRECVFSLSACIPPKPQAIFWWQQWWQRLQCNTNLQEPKPGGRAFSSHLRSCKSRRTEQSPCLPSVWPKCKHSHRSVQELWVTKFSAFRVEAWKGEPQKTGNVMGRPWGVKDSGNLWALCAWIWS